MSKTGGPCRVVVSGAGPAGLLLTSLLLQRNQQQGTTSYEVTLVDPGQNFGLLDAETLSKRHRSWMVGLAGHGLEAFRTAPKLYKDYVKKEGVYIESVSFHLGTTEMKTDSASEGEEGENYIVDRNFIVASVARYLNDLQSPQLKQRYETKTMYVDYERRRVLLRNKEGREEYVPYDLLVGSDGIRSVVREALVKERSDFEMDVGDIFQLFKAVHIDRPKSVDASSVHIMPACFPSMQGIALPETGGKLNISIGGARHKFDQFAPGITSSDPKVVAAYFRETFKPFQLDDYDDLAKQWVGQNWNRTGQCHCNFYHSDKHGKIVLMGDAAHATSPSLGMGMNQALRDAQVFYELLEKHNDDLDQVLPAFSDERVKEGNSLTELSVHLYCMNDWHQGVETIKMVARGILSKMFPSLLWKHPQQIVGYPRYKLSYVYDRAKAMGIIDKHRQINQSIRQTYFEEAIGMVKPVKDGMFGGWFAFFFCAIVAAGGAAAWFLLSGRPVS